MQRFLLLTLVFLFFAIFQIIPNAFATGGAFKDTKHGGGIVDGIDFEGVNRALSNPDYPSGLYNVNVDNPEAGQYQSGECAHCHEPHSSFGGDEPPPDNNAANPYLLMKYGSSVTNYSELCWYCHDNLFGGGGPRTGYWNFYQGGGIVGDPYQQSSHYKSLNFIYPGPQGGEAATEPWPRRSRNSLPSGNTGSCLNCHTPHGISGTSNYPGDVGTPTTTNYAVAPSASFTNPLISRQLIAWEEALCLRCHDGSPANLNKSIKTQVDRHKDVTGLTTGSGHPVRSSATYSRHNLANEGKSAVITGWFGTNPHSECTDCHNPHVATAGVAFGRADVLTPAKIGNVNKGVWGVQVNTITGGAGPSVGANVELDPNTHYLFQLCLKCHSAFGLGVFNVNSTSAVNVGLADPYENLTNVAMEFRTNNNGYHPVFGVGRNMPPAGANPNWPAIAHTGSTGNQTCNDISGISRTTGLGHNFVSPWGPCSLVTCVDCHRYGDGTIGESATQAEGPHGSANSWILRDVDTSIIVNGVSINSGASNWVCYNCHRRDIYGDTSLTGPSNANFSRMPGHPKPGNATEIDPGNNAWRIGCLNCHGGDVLGGIHGTTRTDVGEMTNGAPLGYRLRNGAGVRGHKINGINGAITNTCGTGTVLGPPLTANTALNGCGNNSLARDWTATYEYTGNP